MMQMTRAKLISITDAISRIIYAMVWHVNDVIWTLFSSDLTWSLIRSIDHGMDAATGDIEYTWTFPWVTNLS